MSRRPRPWFREGRGWYAQIEGKHRFLSHDKSEAYDRFHKLMSHRPSSTISGDYVAVVVGLFLDWTELHHAPRTYDWYRERLQWFLGSIPELSAGEPAQALGRKGLHVRCLEFGCFENLCSMKPFAMRTVEEDLVAVGFPYRGEFHHSRTVQTKVDPARLPASREYPLSHLKRAHL